MRNFINIITVLIAVSLSPLACAEVKVKSMEEDTRQIRSWNRFADHVYKLHQGIAARESVHTTERIGGYSGVAEELSDYYREVSYYSGDTNRLLSRIRWVRAKPGTIHDIEVYIYDDKGRLVRDYVAAYLPGARNAPVQTLINLHGTNNSLDAFRQYDASGALIYEQCRGRLGNRKVFLSLEDHQLNGQQEPAVTSSNLYDVCFAGIPTEVEQYLDPMNELKALATN